MRPTHGQGGHDDRGEHEHHEITHAEIEVMFSDVVLGSGMTGFDLVRKARELRPDLRALLTSGYERASLGSDASTAKFEVLRKPYRREQLGAALRKALDSKPHP